MGEDGVGGVGVVGAEVEAEAEVGVDVDVMIVEIGSNETGSISGGEGEMTRRRFLAVVVAVVVVVCSSPLSTLLLSLVETCALSYDLRLFEDE
jgi:hypothetical protein